MLRIVWPLLFLVFAWLVITSEDSKTIIAGIAIFLIGMHYMENGFKLLSGGTLEKVLEKFTSSTPKAIATGFTATTIVQSSSLVAVIVISFLSAELIGLAQAVGVVFGSNIGTTTTAWLVSTFGLKVKISSYALPMLILGVAIQFSNQNRFKGLGSVLIGLGFIFLGIAYMKDGFETLKEGINLADYAMQGYLGIFVYILIGAVATVVIQSSSATMAIIITALASGQIDYINALSLAIGANIGTTVTAMIGAMASNKNGKRLAVAHLIFNLVTGLFAIVFIYQLKDLVDLLAPIMGIGDSNDTMRLALFHTIFNVMGVILVAPFTKPLVRFLQSLFNTGKGQRGVPMYLTSEVAQIPASAIAALRKETIHLYDKSMEAVVHAMNLHRTDIYSKEKARRVIDNSNRIIPIDVDAVYQQEIKYLYSEIIQFSSISQRHMEGDEIQQVYDLKLTARHIVEIVKDVRELQKNMNGRLQKRHPEVKKQYDRLRIHLVKVLRKIQEIREKQTDDERKYTLIQVQQEKAKQSEIDLNAQLDGLIRDNAIAPNFASSLINDIGFTHSISKKLLRSAAVLWIEETEIIELGDDYERQ